MKTFKQYITEGKYDEFKKELFNSPSIQKKLSKLKKLEGFSLTETNVTNTHYIITFEGIEKEDIGVGDSTDYAIFGSFSEEYQLFLQKKSNKIEAFNEKGEKFSLDRARVYGSLHVTEVHIPEPQNLTKEMIQIRIKHANDINNPASNIVIKFPFMLAKLQQY